MRAMEFLDIKVIQIETGECLIDIVSYFVFAVDVYQILVLSGRQLKLHKTILKTSLKVGGHLYNSILTIRLSK